jgi:hypothetical protein
MGTGEGLTVQPFQFIRGEFVFLKTEGAGD